MFMNQTVNISSIFGKWNIDVNTPFGKENYTLSIATNMLQDNINCVAGSIYHEKGSVAFNDARFENDIFHCSVETEFPIKSTISITAEFVEENKMSGMLEIDQYLITSFIGVR